MKYDPVTRVPDSIAAPFGRLLLIEVDSAAHLLNVPAFEVSRDDLRRAASLLVACSGRSTRDETACALIGWLVSSCEGLGVSSDALLLILQDVLTLRASVREAL
jgi:hypothetical protein